MSESNSFDRSPRAKRGAGFLFGILLALLPISAGYLLNPTSAVDFTGGRIELLTIALFIGFSTGHYIGLALGVNPDENLYAAIGAFLTVTGAYAALSYIGIGVDGTIGAISVLTISTFLLILGHYSGIIENKKQIAKMTKQFGEKTSPALLFFIWLLEAIVPPILNLALPVVGLANIGGAIIEGLKWATAIIVLGIVWKGYTMMKSEDQYTNY